MSTTRSVNLKLGTPAANDASWNTVLDANRATFDALTPIGALAVTLHETPSASLFVDVSAGSFISSTGAVITYAGVSSQAIPSGTTKYLYLTDAGVLTLGTAWPVATQHVPLAVVVAGATTIASITDARIVCRSCTR